MTSLTQSIILGACAAGLIGIGIFGAQWYGVNAAKTRLNRELEMNAGYTESILKVGLTDHTTPDTEFYDLCDKAIRWRTDIIAELRGGYSELSPILKADVITYLEDEDAITRAKKSLYKKKMTFLTQYYSLVQHMTESVRLRPSANDARSLGELISVEEAIVSAIPSVHSMAGEVDREANSYIQLYGSLRQSEATVVGRQAKHGLRLPSLLGTYSTASNKEVNESRASYRSSIKWLDSRLAK